MTQAAIHQQGFFYDSYELPLRDTTTPNYKNSDDVSSPASHSSTITSFSLKRRRRIHSFSSSTSLSSSSSCGIHLSSLSLSSMSSSDTNHGIHDFDNGGNLIPSLHCESFTSVEHSNDDYHYYQNAADDDDTPAIGRLSKRHRAYTNLTALCSSTSLSMIGSASGYMEPRIQNNKHMSNDDHSINSDSTDDGWGYYVDTLWLGLIEVLLNHCAINRKRKYTFRRDHC